MTARTVYQRGLVIDFQHVDGGVGFEVSISKGIGD